MKPLSRESVGLAVRAAREAAGLTLRDLAGMTDISFSQLGRTELGERDLAYTELLDIAQALKIDELTLREYAMTFQRDGADEKRQLARDINKAQRLAIEKLIGVNAGLPAEAN